MNHFARFLPVIPAFASFVVGAEPAPPAVVQPAVPAAIMPATDPCLLEVGLARVDITPRIPVRLHGFPREQDRLDDITAVTQRIYAQAIAIGAAADEPVLLVTADVLGFSDEMRTELARRLAKAGFDDPARLTLSATHNHSAPALASVAPYVFRKPPTALQAAHIKEYGDWLMDQLEHVALEALQNRQPARLGYACGSVGFAVNRRMIKDGKMTGFGDNLDGPVDHDLPMLTVKDPSGRLRAVWISYACHGVCWRKPSVHSDWMGTAQKLIEADHPGALALITIGCAGDQNPKGWPDTDVDTPARAVLAEVERLLAGPLRSLTAMPAVRQQRFDLPLASREEFFDWSRQRDWFSRVTVERLARNDASDFPRIPYVIQTWTFADDLAVVFLSGEVTVGYGLRLKRELDSDRLWVNAYSNAAPAYIPTATMLPEGGWEVDGSRLNYGLPARVAPEAEDLIIRTVHELLPPAFDRPATPARADATTSAGNPAPDR